VSQSELVAGWLICGSTSTAVGDQRPQAAATVAAPASRKNTAMALPGGRCGPTRGRDLRRHGGLACAVRQAAAAPPRRGGRRAPATGRREAETALRAGGSCASEGDRCGGASAAWEGAAYGR